MEHETFDVWTKFQSFGLFIGGGGTSHKRIKGNVTCSDPDCCVLTAYYSKDCKKTLDSLKQ